MKQETERADRKLTYVTQSWDDAVIDDARLVQMLRRYKAQATFFVNPGRLGNERRLKTWHHNGHDVGQLSINEVKELFVDFEVASHSLTHPNLCELPPEKLNFELVESRRMLEDWFQRPVRGFSYPGGAFNAVVKNALMETGHRYARTVRNTRTVFPPPDPYEFDTSVHFLADNFWQEFERVKNAGGVFYFWGHSYEMTTDAMWRDFEGKLKKLCTDPSVRWITNIALFDGPDPLPARPR